MDASLQIEPRSVRSLMSSMNEAAAPTKLEAGAVNSTYSATGFQAGQKASLINQIAAQLANSKAAQSQIPASGVTTNPVSLSNGSEKSKNPMVATMTEALSLKQSPTLTKQLSKPSRSSATGMEVITQYMCRYCGQQFESTNDMQLHIQEHVSGKAPHECSVCGKTYRTPSKLQRHVRVHSGERPYACSICGRRFTRSDHVKQHMKVHCQPKDANVCHLCNDMKFSRRQALHQHLQQQHFMQQVFTCHRCGEAFESLEEMQSHKLTHDSVLNSLKDSTSVTPSQNAVAKFALCQQKNDQGISKYDTIKSDAKEDLKAQGVVIQVPSSNGFFIPSGTMDSLTAYSNKVLMEGIAKEAAEMEVQKKYQEELMQLSADARKYQVELELEQKRRDEEERAKIAECFTIKASASSSPVLGEQKLVINESDDSSMEIVAGKETTTVINGDGMSMFILPTEEKDEKSETEMEADDQESEQNSSKDSSGINREGDGEKSEGDNSDKVETNTESERTNDQAEQSDEEGTKEDKISKLSKIEGYTKPCPKSKKPGYHAPTTMETRTLSSEEYPGLAPKPMLSLLNPKLNELIKAKVEQNMSQSQSQTTLIVTNPPMQQQMPKLTFIPNITGNKFTSLSSLPTILPAPSFGPTGNLLSIQHSQPVPKTKSEQVPKLIKCEHCCIYFEDTAMSMLHNTLHSADNADPFTCRKCFKKLGNRLEFMAHMVWHLEPNMDI